jgi:hypothetical protein
MASDMGDDRAAAAPSRDMVAVWQPAAGVSAAASSQECLLRGRSWAGEGELSSGVRVFALELKSHTGQNLYMQNNTYSIS